MAFCAFPKPQNCGECLDSWENPGMYNTCMAINKPDKYLKLRAKSEEKKSSRVREVLYRSFCDAIEEAENLKNGQKTKFPWRET